MYFSIKSFLYLFCVAVCGVPLLALCLYEFFRTDVRIDAATVLAPTHSDLVSLPTDRLEWVIAELMKDSSGSISTLLHAIHLSGPKPGTLEGGNHLGAESIDALLDVSRTRDLFGGRPHLALTRHGIAFPLYESKAIGLDQFNVQSHNGQGLATLACSGLQLNCSVNLGDGKCHTIKEMLDHSVAHFTFDGEVYWDAIALAIYLPPQKEWTNRLGQAFDFDALAVELLRRKPEQSSCAGTHSLISLVILLRCDDEIAILSPKVRRSVESSLQSTVDVLMGSTTDEGLWDLQWYERSGATSLSSDSDVIIATGHHLEWLEILPPRIRVDDEVLARAAVALFHRLVTSIQTGGAPWVGEAFCPLTHAARSICILANNSYEVDGIGSLNTLKRERGF